MPQGSLLIIRPLILTWSLQGIDSLITIVHYNTPTFRYTSYVYKCQHTRDLSLLDSSVFVYDGSGKIIGEDLYESPSGAGNDYYLSGKVNYTYSPTGNITASWTFMILTSLELKYLLPTHQIPVRLKNECHSVSAMKVLSMGHPEWTSANNISSEQLGDSNGPVDDQNVTVNYTYNNAINRELTCLIYHSAG